MTMVGIWRRQEPDEKSKSCQLYDRTVDFMGVDSETNEKDILAIIKETKKDAISIIDNRRILPSKVTPKLSHLWGREKQYEQSPVKIFDPEEIRELNKRLKITERMIDIKE